MKEFELESGEFVVLHTRKHWFLFVVGLVPFLILALLPIVLPLVILLTPPLAALAPTIDYTQPLMRATLGLWLLLVWTAAWGSFTRYYLNAWVLTSQRIVEIKQRRYFHREVSSLMLNRVQDVTTEVAGVIPSLLGMGSIKVQSAGAENEFHMRGIPEPELVRNLILKYIPEEPQTPGV
ncbi:MAG: PH domain-containing protein [Candidatus Paceibacterota bacterium]